jgi:L-asparaginase II
MFADTPPVEQQKSKNNDLNIIQNLWLQMIDEEGRAFNNKDLALLIESHGFYPSQIQQALGILIKEGLVENMDDKTGKRRKNFIHFEKNERLRRIK